MRLKGYGNAIVAPAAQVFVETAMAIVERRDPNQSLSDVPLYLESIAANPAEN